MNVKDLKNEEQANGLSNNLENDIQDKIISRHLTRCHIKL